MLPEAASFKKNWQAAHKTQRANGGDCAFVYAHLEADTGNPFYIGMGSQLDRPWLLKRNRYHDAVTRKHGARVEIILCNLTWEQACFWEIRWVKALREAGYQLTNMTDGGEGVKGLCGTKNPCACLTDALALEILTSPEKTKHIAERLQLNYYTVWGVRARKTWAHLPEPDPELTVLWASRKGQKGRKFPESKKKEMSFLRRGENGTCAKITEKIATEILLSPEKNKEISDRLGVSYRLVADIRNRRTWKHLPEATEDVRSAWNETSGERNPSARLTVKEAQEILDSTESTVELARKYSVSYHTIRLIRKRELWKHLKPSRED